jgi:excinuclease UvrABC ATPase subunit
MKFIKKTNMTEIEIQRDILKQVIKKIIARIKNLQNIGINYTILF